MKNLSHFNVVKEIKKNGVRTGNGQMIRVTASFSCLLMQNLPDSISRAVNFLETRLPHLTYSYAVAMTSYALANEKKLNRTKLFQYNSSGNVYASVYY